jgi:PAS domain S-box-containing protein
MSSFDGYAVHHLPSPGNDLRVEEGTNGELWALDISPETPASGLKVFSQATWQTFPLGDIAPTDPESIASGVGAHRFLPFDGGRAFYLARDGLREFDSVTGRSTPMHISGCSLGDLRSISSGFWLAGVNGVGRISRPAGDDSVSCTAWGGNVPRRFTEFSNLFDDGDTLLATARDGPHRRVLLRLTAFGWQQLAAVVSDDERLCGWNGHSGSVWILHVQSGEQRLIYRSADGTETPAPKSKVLSARITDIAVQGGGIFWIASTIGLARCAPPVWQQLGPPGVSEKAITAIIETPSHDLAFLGVNTLWILRQGSWLAKPLPVPPATNIGYSNRMTMLRNSKIAIPVRISRSRANLLLYDPARDRFETPVIPGFNFCAFGEGRSGGRVWAACRGPGPKRITLFSYDGARFEKLTDLQVPDSVELPRAILERADGSVWIGAFWPQSLYRYAGGVTTNVRLPPEAESMGISDMVELEPGKLWAAGRNLLLEYSGSAWKVLRSNLETVRFTYRSRDGSVWVTGGAGLMRCRDGGCVSVGVEDGLPQGAGWTVLEDSSGRLLVGTTTGVRFRDTTADRDPPTTEIPRQLNFSRFAPGVPVLLQPAGSDRWHYTEDSRLLFSYRLDGGPWSPFDDVATIAPKGIAAGSHAIDVRSMDRAFNIGAPAQFPFEVLAPWYSHPIIVGPLILALLLLAYSVRQHVNRHRELAYLVDEKTRQLAADFEERSRLRARFESILDHAPAVIYVTDLGGRYVVSNLRHQAVLSKTRVEIIGRTDEEIFGPGTHVPFRARDTQVLGERRVIQFEETVQKEPSSRIYLSIKCPLYDSSGQPNAICGISSDITESKLLEERLQHSQRLEAIGLLAGGIAHDFNNLLMVISGYAALLCRESLHGTEANKRAMLILQASEKAATLTHQLLAFGRRQIMQPRVIDANQAVEEVCSMLRRTVPETIDMRISPSPLPALVRVDPAQLEQVVMNLVLNARDAMPEGGELKVDVQILDEPPGRIPMREACVRLRIADSGIGMDEETRTRMFEPFFTTKPQGQGTGLGLATVYGIVRQSEGEIDVRSALGQGTTVDVYLRRSKDDLHPTPEPRAISEPSGHERILVVEDQPDVGELISEVLSSHGYKVHLVTQPSEALRTADRFDLLITDLVMPGMLGTELARKLMSAHPRLRVILMSGYADTRTDAERQALDVAFLQKPFAPAALLKVVFETLRKQQGANSRVSHNFSS